MWSQTSRAQRARGRGGRAHLDVARVQAAGVLAQVLAQVALLEQQSRRSGPGGREQDQKVQRGLTTYSKTKVRDWLVCTMSWRTTMLACFRRLRSEAANSEPERVRRRRRPRVSTLETRTFSDGGEGDALLAVHPDLLQRHQLPVDPQTQRHRLSRRPAPPPPTQRQPSICWSSEDLPDQLGGLGQSCDLSSLEELLSISVI